jgi:type II secretion system protein E
MPKLPEKTVALEDVMLQAHIINAEQHEQLKNEIAATGSSIEKILSDKKFATSQEIELAKESIELGIPCISLADLPKDETATAKMTSSFAFKNRIVPVSLEGDVLTIAMSDPLDIMLIDEIRLVTECEVKPLLGDRDDIEDAIRRYYGKSATDIISGELRGPAGVTVQEGIETIRDYGLDAAAHDPTVMEAVNQLIIDAVRQNATDIHVEPFAREVKIRYRIDGVLEEQPPPPRHLQWALTSRVKIMAEMDIAQKRFPQDGKISRTIESLGNREIDIRVSTVPTQWGESVVLRILDKKAISYGLEHLGMMDDTLKKFQKLIEKPHGIILVTGPTGSGKTTTLYACLKEKNTPDVKIITIEEPVEYDLPGINQIDVNVDLDLTFAVGLRYILRQDPDIVMVGEIRDYEAAEMAIHTALTGHLDFSTLHTNDAASAITRLIDMGVEPFLVASTVEGIAAQRLVRRVCQYCSELYHPDQETLLDLGLKKAEIDNLPDDFTIRRHVGCRECRDTGYSGRTGIFEIIPMNEHIREMCIKGITSNEIKREAIKTTGMKTLRDDGWRKVKAGITTIEEVMRLTSEADFEIEQIN